RIAAARGFVDEPRQLLIEEGAVRQASERVVRREVLQGQLVLLGASLGFATVRNILKQHGVNAARARIEIRDRELDVAALVIATHDLRRAADGLFVALLT